VATGGRLPDRTLLFDLPATAARARGHSASRQERGAADRLDSEALEFYERVRQGFLEMSRGDARFRVISSSGPQAATETQVRVALADLPEGSS
jgi:dTMP kinase